MKKGKKKIRVSEIVSLVFGNWLLLACLVSAFFGWWAVFCPSGDQACLNSARYVGMLAMFGSGHSILLWLAFSIYAIITGDPSENRKTAALRFGLITSDTLIVIWLITLFIIPKNSFIFITFVCASLITADVLYVRTARSSLPKNKA